MDCRIFIKLPVRNVVASSAFYAALGADWDERFGDGSSALMRLTDTIAVILLHRDRFAGSALRDVADARTHSQMLLRLDCADRDEVDRLARIASWAGGRAAPHAEDMGSTYCRSFEDPDGHLWEAVWMNDAVAVAPRERMQAA